MLRKNISLPCRIEYANLWSFNLRKDLKYVTVELVKIDLMRKASKQQKKQNINCPF